MTMDPKIRDTIIVHELFRLEGGSSALFVSRSGRLWPVWAGEKHNFRPTRPQPRAFKADRRQSIEIDEHFAGRADIFPQ